MKNIAYYPYLPITWVNRFIEGMKIDQDTILTPKRIKELGIPEPGKLIKSFKYIGLISDENTLTDLGKRFIDFRSRKDACQEILEKPPYNELVYRMKQGEFLSRTKLREYFEGMTAWTVDTIEKTLSFFLYFLKNADYEELKDVEFIKKAQTRPRIGIRLSQKERLKTLLFDEDQIFNELIDKIKQLIGIYKADGTIFFKMDQNELTDHQTILIYLLGAKFAYELELREYPEVNNQELAKFLDRDPNAIASRISELRKEKKVLSPRRGFHTVKPIDIKDDIEKIIPLKEYYKQENVLDYPIAIKHLKLQNIRCFKKLDIHFGKGIEPYKWNVLVGNNGVGKTTILQMIALCALGSNLSLNMVPLPNQLIRKGSKEGFIEAVFDIKDGNEVRIHLRIDKTSRTFELKSNEDNSKYFIRKRENSEFYGWLVNGYGASRNLFFVDEPSKIGQQDLIIDRVESLFKPTKVLIEPNVLEELLKGDLHSFRELGAPSKINPKTLESLIDIIDKLLPEISCRDLNEKGDLISTTFGRVPIDGLSEGYKSMLSWVSHLLVHLLYAANWTGDFSSIRGIVLLDEVDLHLHPKWQQEVIPSLRECFPFLQFIVTTHSPMTIGGVNDGEVILLEQKAGDIIAKTDLPSIRGWRADQVLTGPLFGLESTRDLETTSRIEEYTKLISQSELSEIEKKRLEKLRKILKDTIPTSGETEIEREALRLVEETMKDYLNKKSPEERKKLLNQILYQLQR